MGDELPFVYFRRKFHSLAITDDRTPDGRGLASIGAAGSVVVELDMGWM
jgi:hypothetical protein